MPKIAKSENQRSDLTATAAAKRKLLWRLAIAAVSFCALSFALQIYAPVFANRNEILIVINKLLHWAHFVAFIGLCMLCYHAVLGRSLKQCITFALFTIISFLTYDKLLVPTRMAIVKYALSDTETVMGRVTGHGRNSIGDVKNLPRTFLYTFEYQGKSYDDFYPISEEIYNEERKKLLRVGGTIKLGVSKKFPSLNKLLE